MSSSTTTTTTSSSSSSSSSTAGTITEMPRPVSEYTPGTTHAFMVYDNRFVVDAKYMPLKPLGRGAYGVVCSAIDRTTNRKVAIKKITKAFHDMIDGKRDLREIKLLRHFQHDNIVRLVDVMGPTEEAAFEDVYIVLDFMETDLHKIIYSKNDLTDGHVQFFVYQILKALKYIHSARVIHRDLKPSNLLLNGNCDLKVCDFGLARGVSATAEDDLTEYVVTRWYRAPEVILGCHYDNKIDVWSVGCIMAELLGRRPLFPSQNSDYSQQLNLIFEAIGTPHRRDDVDFISHEKALEYVLALPPKPARDWGTVYPTANKLAIDLLGRMLTFNPRRRISVDEALEHPYFKTRHNLAKETTCPTPFDFSFERVKMTKEVLQDLMWGEVVHFHPELKTRGFRRAKHAPLVQPNEYHFDSTGAPSTSSSSSAAKH